MAPVLIADNSGKTLRVFEFHGKHYPVFPVIDQVLPYLPDIPCRDDDVMILTYPKAGTHWSWEIVNMLCTGDGQISKRHKIVSMLERATLEEVAALPSVRLLNTHLPPEFYPRDLIKRKCKVIFVQRNPKDIYTSFYHHTYKWKQYHYDGEWKDYFELLMEGKNDYGSWFDWTKQYEQFFSENPDIPVLRLYYEDMKQDLPAEIDKIVQFLDIRCEPSYKRKVAEKCEFQNMKAERQLPPEKIDASVRGKEHPTYRKGVVGDWKTHFTVAQNERFDAEYKKQMKGFTFQFEQYM